MDQSQDPGTAVRDDDDAPPPVASHRGLLGVVIGMGLLIVIAVAVVIYGLVYKMSGEEESAAADPAAPEASGAPYRASPQLPGTIAGIESFAVGDYLAIHARRAEAGGVILLIDPATGAEIGRLTLPDADKAP